MFSKKECFLIKDNIRRTASIKFKYNSLLRTSLTKNSFIGNTKKLYYKTYNTRGVLYKKQKDVCLLSGENTSVRKNLLLSRFQINYLSLTGSLQNFKINTW